MVGAMTDEERSRMRDEMRQLQEELPNCERCNGLRQRILDIYKLFPENQLREHRDPHGHTIAYEPGSTEPLT
jgi:hypothetical protein